jgi:regulator of protease activity HflC (stomatin/prohibitin superfamily)
VSRLCELCAPVVPPWCRKVSELIAVVLIVCVIALVTIWRSRIVTTIYSPLTGLLYRDGQFTRDLPPGRYAWFDPFKRTKVVTVSLAEMPVTLSEVTVLSKDQFSYRLALSPIIKVVDAQRYAESQPAAAEIFFNSRFITASQNLLSAAMHPTLSPVVSAAALEAAGSRTLAETIASPAELTVDIQARLLNAVPGTVIATVLLTSINLPPETRKLFTDVERSRIEAQSSLERARGEQASLRVLANAARLVDGNPGLANLRLLQAIETTKGSTTIILGEAVLPGGFGSRPTTTS